MMQIQECVRSLVPGRVRIRHPALKGLTSEDEKLLVQTAKSVEGILAVRVNPAVGSLLIVWDEDVLSQQELCEALEFLATALGLDVGNGTASTPQAGAQTSAVPAWGKKDAASRLQETADVLVRRLVPDVKNIKRARRMAQNRVMLGLGAACVAALAMNKRLHGVLGYAFTALALVHSYQHRRVI